MLVHRVAGVEPLLGPEAFESVRFNPFATMLTAVASTSHVVGMSTHVVESVNDPSLPFVVV